MSIEATIGLAVSAVLSILAWSLKRNLSQLDKQLGAMAADIRTNQTSTVREVEDLWKEIEKVRQETTKLAADFASTVHVATDELKNLIRDQSLQISNNRGMTTTAIAELSGKIDTVLTHFKDCILLQGRVNEMFGQKRTPQ